MKPINPGRMPIPMLLHEVIVTADMGVCHLTVNLQVVKSGCCHFGCNGGR